MGNCIRHEPQEQWGGEDWSAALTKHGENSYMIEELGGRKMVDSSSGKGYKAASTTTKVREVKVKITKKEFEKLLGKVDVQQKGLSVEQVLGQLMKLSVHCESHQRSWRPMLQSIPEV